MRWRRILLLLLLLALPQPGSAADGDEVEYRITDRYQIRRVRLCDRGPDPGQGAVAATACASIDVPDPADTYKVMIHRDAGVGCSYSVDVDVRDASTGDWVNVITLTESTQGWVRDIPGYARELRANITSVSNCTRLEVDATVYMRRPVR